MAERDTLAVVNHHIEAMGTKDIDNIMSDYAEDAIILTTLSDKPLIGHAAIKEAVEKVLQAETPPDFEEKIKMLMLQADGEYAVLAASAEPYMSIASDAYIVKNGKIVFESAFQHHRG